MKTGYLPAISPPTKDDTRDEPVQLPASHNPCFWTAAFKLTSELTIRS